jgi:hypothetical protein
VSFHLKPHISLKPSLHNERAAATAIRRLVDPFDEEIFRLLCQEFWRTIKNIVNRNHYTLAAAWRVTVATWLRCQGTNLDPPAAKQESLN